jgi:NTP pyrophosphatase (non-canonical NTP hydrolase)
MTDFKMIRCTFCGNTQNEAKKIIKGMGEVFICDGCVAASVDILRESNLGVPCGVCADRRALHEAGHVETQRSIAEWADQAFGRAPSLARIAARANEEMAGLLREAASEDSDDREHVENLVAEAADVVTILYHLAQVAGHDLHEAIDRKMAINRQRQWRRDGTGHGYHVGGA